MKRPTSPEEPTTYALHLMESGMPAVNVAPQLGGSEAAHHICKKKLGDMGLTELELRSKLEEENARLKRILVDLMVDQQNPQDVDRQKP